MFEEPRLVPLANFIQLSWLTAVNQVASHNYSLFSGVDQTFDEVGGIAPLNLPLEGLNHLLERINRGVIKSDKSS